MLGFGYRELVDCQPVVRLWIVEIHEPHMIAGDAAIGTGVLDGYAIAQKAVNGAVGLNQGG